MTPAPTSAGSFLPKRAAILGFARSGRALAGALLDRGVEVAIGDRRPQAAFDGVEELRSRGARFFFGGAAEGFLDGAGWLALSPGVPLSEPPVAAARDRAIPVLSEIEIAWRIAEREVSGKNRWVAVTGTNGKSTTTAWIADILRRAGRPVALAGNIGVPLSSFLSERTPRDFVCEVSSFQLETVDEFAPDVAVLTNVTPDHLDRYPGFAEYAAAKERVFRRQGPDDFAVINADDPIAAAVRVAARRVPFSRAGRADGGAWIEAGSLVSAVSGLPSAGFRTVIPVGDLALPGAHNLENALAAVCAADCLGVPDGAIREGLACFPGLPHRMELVAESRGVRWINDSKGTNVDATKKSLEGYPPGTVILILGGRDKHGDFAALAPLAGKAAFRILTIGEAASTVEAALAAAAATERAGTMDRAVARAAEIARPGDTVLLSPACASFDQYGNYEERGAHFARLAREAADGVSERSHGA
jgi:UDP-N-acetylmuramoylalanine--D-glutamate ligase